MAVRKHKIINRELSWLSFNSRVLQEAADPRVPLVERIRFLGIVSNNLDEFFRVRVATVARLQGVTDRKVNNYIGGTPEEVLAQIQEIVLGQQKEFEIVYQKIIKGLAAQQIFIINETQLSDKQSRFVNLYFKEKVQPVLVPIMVHQVQKFPYLRDKSIYLAVKLYNEKDRKKPDYALLEIPTQVLPRFLVLPTIGSRNFIMLLDDVIRHCLHDIFGIFDYDRIEAYTFKITRDAELDIDNQDISRSFMETMKRSLKQRKLGQPVRFVHDENMPDDLLHFLTKRMKLKDLDNVIPGGRYHNFKDFIKFPYLGQDDLINPPAPPLPHRHLAGQYKLFRAIRKQDILLHYPYHTFNHFIDLLREAAIDPKVRSIRITLYRVADKSQVVNALINAAKNGKKVIVVVELQARFDEEANIKWA
ncbi:MAG: RNA degradosome polyphosphate kinase, partial [Bacteroidota bacterium]